MLTIQVLDKSTSQLVASLPVDDEHSVIAAANRARAAQPKWAALPIKERIRLLKLARKEFLKDKDKIRDALAQETGKVPFDVIGEIFSVCQDIGHFSKKAGKWLKPRKVGTFPLLGKKGLIFYQPYGLVGVISPWNAPLTLAMSDVLPALYAGNAVLVKPSEITPLAVKYAVDAFNRVLPSGRTTVSHRGGTHRRSACRSGRHGGGNRFLPDRSSRHGTRQPAPYTRSAGTGRQGPDDSAQGCRY